MLRKGFRISLRRSFAVVELVGKVNHAMLVDHQSAAKLRQFAYQLYNTHALFVLFVKGCSYTDFLCRIYVCNGIFNVFIGEDLLNIMPVGGKIEQRKGIGGTHHLHNLQHAFLCGGKVCCRRCSCFYQFHNCRQRNGKLHKHPDLFIGDIHGSTADTARRQGMSGIGYLVLPEIKGQQILIKDAHVPTSNLSCFLFFSIVPYD